MRVTEREREKDRKRRENMKLHCSRGMSEASLVIAKEAVWTGPRQRSFLVPL